MGAHDPPVLNCPPLMGLICNWFIGLTLRHWGCTILLFLLWFSPQLASAAIRKSDNPNIKMFMIPYHPDDFALRVEAMRRAKVSIIHSSFGMDMGDYVGGPIAGELRDAANRKVTVQGVTEYYPSVFLNGVRGGTTPIDIIQGAIDANPNCGSGFFCLTGADKTSAGYSQTDWTHIKVTGIDIGTADEILLFGSPNTVEVTKDTIETVMVMVRDNKALPSAISLVQDLFHEEVYNVALKMIKARGGKPENIPTQLLQMLQKKLSPEEMASHAFPQDKLLSETSPQFEYYKKILFEGAEDTQKLFVRPEKFTLASNNFFGELDRLGLGQAPNEQRAALLLDDVVKLVATSIRANEMPRLLLMNGYLAPEIEAAIKDLLQAGGHIELYTNSLESDRVANTYGKQYLMGVPTLARLQKYVDSNSKAKLTIHLLDPKRAELADYYFRGRYVHGKLAGFKNCLMSGSHNLNIASCLNNSEAMLRLDGEEVGKAVNAYFDSILPLFSPATCSQLLNDAKTAETFGNRLAIQIMSPFF